jgi:hypothetical protein
MQLVEDWQKVITKARSVKFTIASILLSAIEVAVQLVQPAGIPGGVFASFAGLVSVGAAVARIWSQKEFVNAAAQPE